MITNDRQYRISRTQLKKLGDAVEAFDIEESEHRLKSPILAKAEVDALMSEVDNLESQVREYENLKSGLVTEFRADSMKELPTVLIKARIANGMSQRNLAEALGIKEQQIQRYESDNYASASLHRLTEVADALRLNVSEIAELNTPLTREEVVEQSKIDWHRFPLREMYRRGRFEDFNESLDAALTCGRELLEEFLKNAMPRRQPALFRGRARAGSQMDKYALLAWECRVLMVAKQQELEGTYTSGVITEDWLRTLAKESAFEDGPRRARKYLSRSGIPLVVEPHLPKTHLDGAALLLPDGSPVIGLTLRYDRLDNFWFVLFHELAHIAKHLRKGRIEVIFDDLDSDRDTLEDEADEFAGAMLISPDTWETALARYLRTKETVISLGLELAISPAIIAGRIQKEANNYILLGDLVGRGKVRNYFTEVCFAQ